MDLNTRQKDLEALSEFINSSESRLANILENIGWSNDGSVNSNAGINKKNLSESEIWCRSTKEKLSKYTETLNQRNESASEEFDHLPTVDDKSSDKKVLSLVELSKLKRDLKRRRLKHRTSKAPPLSYTEEVRGLIGLQMESWQQYLAEEDNLKK